jgi:hypothetical protein
MNWKKENMSLIFNDPVEILEFDDQLQHVLGHQRLFTHPLYEADVEFKNRVTKHIDAHLMMIRYIAYKDKT